ncbi:S8 family serine peptidase [Bacillus sp. AFS017336]|uniref:S8 family serine peptidase n=1 Tax=Bacillus sp. AFS017336 TaxID=2033489 RepID=UPI000BF0FA1F|nr:S8 family serine peptidase [Bacillus sp. AFS017336]PEK98048.1 hypothetical protein CN601_26290 [Bacillus sp. AFS017336]
MKKSKINPFKVMSTAALTSLLFTSLTVFAESIDNPSEPTDQAAPVLVQHNVATEQVKPIYKDVKKDNQIKSFKPDDLVHLIVEVDQPAKNVQTTPESKIASFKQKQDNVIEQISKEKKSKSNDSVKLKHRYYQGFNGFSVETQYKNMKDIQSIPGVKHVHIARTYTESMAASKELVQAQKVWEQYGYKGEGLLVGVVDSGIDYTHKDLTLSDEAKAKEKWNQNNIQQKFAETSVNEKWYSDKVPTGYDWADNDTDVIPGATGSPHGTHVSGIVGANGDETKGGVAGIAPGVQLLAEKVFSDKGGGAMEDDIIAGMEHAVTMGADVINMSLGTDAGTVDEDYDPIQKEIRLATERGTLVVVAAGNAGYSTYNNLSKPSLKPFAEDPDIGTVGSPGVSPFALSVASYENTKIHMNAISDGNGLSIPFKDQDQFAPSYNFKVSKNLLPDTNYDLVYVGEGVKATDYPKGKTGYIAVVKLLNWYSTVSSIQFTAKSAGAKAIIMIPPTGSINYDYAPLPATPVATPTASTSKAIGETLLNKMNSMPSGQYITMKNVGDYWVDNPSKDTMSYFSSMGTTPTLDFKPEISAPGGNIYSTIPGNDYEVMSGTSMATPHVAGGSALLLQSLYQKGLTHSEDTVLKAKIALMNTAKVVMDPKTNNAIPYSPRIQGSGLMQIQNAIQTPVIVTRKNTPLEQAGAVALKEIKNDRAIFNLNVESLEINKTKKEYEYTVNVDLLTDGIETKQFDLDNDGALDTKDYLSLKSKRIEGASIYVNGEKLTDVDGATLKIKTGQKKNLNVEIRLPRTLKKNEFVEGFVRLVPTGEDSDSAVPLSIPYMGFYGKWDEPRNIDAPAWEKDAFVGYTALWNDDSEGSPLGFNGHSFDLNHIAYSPNYVDVGIYGSMQALRNLAKAEMSIEDSSGKQLKYLGDYSEYNGNGQPWKFSKNIMMVGDYGTNLYQWDMKDQSGNYVPDGLYNYVIKTTLDYPNAKPQTVKMPMLVDSIAPKVSDIKVTPKDGKYEVSFNASDNASDFNSAVVYVNGKSYVLGLEQKSVLVPTEPKGIVILALDYAGNISWTPWGDQSYNTQSMVIQTIGVSPSTNVNEKNPAKIVSWAHNRVDWTINVKDANGKLIDSWDVKNEHTLKAMWLPETDLPNGTYYISADIVTKDGFKITTTTKTVTVKQ